MQSLGVRLRLERERQGVSLEKIADDTRISHRYLEAIEADDQSPLPGEFFYRAFVRQYSKYLGWNPDEIEKQINLVSPIPVSNPLEPVAVSSSPLSLVRDQQIHALRETLKDAPLRSAQDSGMHRAWLVFALLVILICASYFGYKNFSPPGEVVAKSTPPVAAPAPVVPAPAPAIVEQPQTQTQAPALPVETVSAPTVPTQPASGTFSLTIRAKEMTWIRLTADGTKVHGGTLDAGQERTVNASNVELLVGNCGTLDVIYNGKQLSYGTKGEVKTLLVSPDGWKFKAKPMPESTNPPTGSATGNTTAGILAPRAL